MAVTSSSETGPERADGTPPPAPIFISYSSADRSYVDQLARYLRGCGLPVWFDRQIHVGEVFSDRLEKQIRGCAAVVVVVTPAAVQSKWVRREVHFAEAAAKPLFPLRLVRGEHTLLLSGVHHEDVIGGRLPSDAFVETLRRACRDSPGVGDVSGGQVRGWTNASDAGWARRPWSNAFVALSLIVTATLTGSVRVVGDRLTVGETARPGRVLSSPNGRYHAVLDEHGNLIVSGPRAVIAWDSGSGDASTPYLTLQPDGNLVVRRGDNTVVWASNTDGLGGVYVEVQNDGRLGLYSAAGTEIWAGTRKNTMFPKQVLRSGDRLRSPNGYWALRVTDDGALIIDGADGQTDTIGGPLGGGARLELGADASLTLVAGSRRVVVAPADGSAANVRLEMQDDGNVVLSGGGHRPRWSTAGRKR